ncbi:MAG: ArsC family reductase [Pseudomonadota bacterium]
MKLYGIKNCDTVKKARAWLADRGLSVPFHDFKSEGVTPALLERWEKAVGWETLVNRKGTTWRALTDDVKNGVVDAGAAQRLMVEKPSLIKRPVLEVDGQIYVGFAPEIYKELFKDL